MILMDDPCKKCTVSKLTAKGNPDDDDVDDMMRRGVMMTT